jgi:hypothetical protein
LLLIPREQHTSSRNYQQRGALITHYPYGKKRSGLKTCHCVIGYNFQNNYHRLYQLYDVKKGADVAVRVRHAKLPNCQQK